MDSDLFLKALKLDGAKYVYNRFLLDEEVFILKKSHPHKHVEVYHELKAVVSNALNVPLKNVAIVGSAKTGYSLSPGKNFRCFDSGSDLDLIVVSRELFERLWASHLSYKNNVIRSKDYSYASVAKDIFRHFITFKLHTMDSSMLEHFSDWLVLVSNLKRTLEQQFSVPEINYRIYESWEYVEQYHVAGLNEVLREYI